MRPLNARQIGELEAREFLGDETWKRWKIAYDEAMGYRKTLKGKPTEEQLLTLQNNAMDIEFYGSVLFHSATLANRNMCGCTRCGQARQNK
jgi:hypothetical protein